MPDSLTVEKANPRESYYLEDFEEIGEGMGPTLLDMINANPCSRISTSVYRSLKVIHGLSQAQFIPLERQIKFGFNFVKRTTLSF